MPLEEGQDSAGKWGTITEHVGHDSAEVGQPGLVAHSVSAQIISGECGSVGMTSVVDPDLPSCNQRFSISSILRRTCSQ